ncbi:GroES chaperonin family protein [Listeria phage LIS04]|nr:GroES chaperonin family protein [Listeria phage LIS04]
MEGIKAVGDTVFIKLLPQDQSKGSIYIPPQDKSQKDLLLAEVLAVGPGIYYKTKFVPNEVEVGDKVLVAKLAVKKSAYNSLSYVRHVDVEAILPSKD